MLSPFRCFPAGHFARSGMRGKVAAFPRLYRAGRCLVVFAGFAFDPAPAAASGFGLIENSASGMGVAYAGAAASAEDAGTIFFNPAGMAYLTGRQAVAAIHVLAGSGAFRDDGSTGAAGRTPGEGDSASSGAGVLPDVYYAMRLRPDLHAGIGINSPFGLDTEYDPNWIGRFHSLKTSLHSMNINPALAWKVNDVLSVGAGVSAMRVEAELAHAVNFVLAEGAVSLRGSGWGYGCNVGAILQPSPDWRIGLAYRSKIREVLKGEIAFTRPAGLPAASTAAAYDSGGVATLVLPESVSLSGAGRLDADWEWLADVTWTRWSRFGALRIERENGAILSETPLNWRNTFRYSLGGAYRYSEDLKLRMGMAYDGSTTGGKAGNASLPDGARKWLTAGIGYRYSDRLRLDLAAAHFYLRDIPVDDDQRAAGNGYLTGHDSATLNIFSMQIAYMF